MRRRCKAFLGKRHCSVQRRHCRCSVDAAAVRAHGRLRSGWWMNSGLALAAAQPAIRPAQGDGRGRLVGGDLHTGAAAHERGDRGRDGDDLARDVGAIEPCVDERQLLWTAAIVHDIGTAVDYGGRPSHARYLLLNGELYGFAPRDVALVAQIVRYHRRGVPALDEARSLVRRGTASWWNAARCCCGSPRSCCHGRFVEPRASRAGRRQAASRARRRRSRRPPGARAWMDR